MTTAMPAVKPAVTGNGTNSMSFPIPVTPMQDEEDARHRRGQEQAAQAEAGRDRDEDGHEGGGRPRDLHARPAEERDDGAADDGGVEPVLGRHAGGDGQRHRQRKGHDADHDAGHGVVPEVRPAVAGPEHGAQGGAEAMERGVPGARASVCGLTRPEGTTRGAPRVTAAHRSGAGLIPAPAPPTPAGGR